MSVNRQTGSLEYRRELKKMFDLQKFGMKFGLDNMRAILKKLGNPHEGLRFVHLAGTNGKGSVGAMLRSILMETGGRIGFYASPHLATFRERITINGDMINEEETLKLSRRVWSACDPEAPPTFFEFVTAMAFLYFKNSAAELAVIEAGLGGRLDSTNVIKPLLSIITNVSLEHTAQLGDTVAAIAAEKAGIIKPAVPLVAGRLDREAHEEIMRAADERRAPAALLGRDFSAELTAIDDRGRPVFDYAQKGLTLRGLKPALGGSHQVENAALAVRAALELPWTAAGGKRAGEEEIRRGLSRAVWPGRAEWFEAGAWPPDGSSAAAPLMLDGAHNPAGAEALARTLSALSAVRPRGGLVHLVAGVMADKDIAGVLSPLLRLAGRLYLTRPAFSRAASPEFIQARLEEALGRLPAPTTRHDSIPQALAAAAAEARPDDLVVLSGSLFTVGEARAYLTGGGEVESN